MKRRSVWVIEVAVLNAVRPTIQKWEVWEAHNTRSEAVHEIRKMRERKPSWESAKFFDETVRVVRYDASK